MFTSLIALVGPALLGILSGVGINLVGFLTGGGSTVARAVPIAVRLAVMTLRRASETDRRTVEAAEQVIAKTDRRTVEAAEREVDAAERGTE